MTILEAINAATEQLNDVRLPVRDADNAGRVRTALLLLDAIGEALKKQEAAQPEPEKGADET